MSDQAVAAIEHSSGVDAAAAWAAAAAIAQENPLREPAVQTAVAEFVAQSSDEVPVFHIKRPSSGNSGSGVATEVSVPNRPASPDNMSEEIAHLPPGVVWGSDRFTDVSGRHDEEQHSTEGSELAANFGWAKKPREVDVPLVENYLPPAPTDEAVPQILLDLADTPIQALMLKAYQGLLDTQDFEALAQTSSEENGGKFIADGLEWLASQPEGSTRLVDLFAQAAEAENAHFMAQILANMAAAAPEQALGLLLLTTDDPNGTGHMSNFFESMSTHSEAARNFALFFDNVSQSPDTGQSLLELLDHMSQASPDSQYSTPQSLARLFAEASTTPQAARSLANGFVRTLDTEGGARSFARLVSRLSATDEGADNVATMLHNLSRDDAGAQSVGRILERASSSRDGARQILETFQRIALQEDGIPTLGGILARLATKPHGIQLLANLAADPSNAQSLAELLDHAASSRVAPRLRNAFEHVESTIEMEHLYQRASQSQQLTEVLARLEWLPGTALASAAQPRSDLELLRLQRPFLAAPISRSQQDEEVAEEEMEEAPKGRFRPGDWYSKSTLRAAHICGECGFRLTPAGICLRCEEFVRREVPVRQEAAVGAVQPVP